MNMIIFRQEELTGEGRVALCGRRAKHIVGVLRGQIGQTVQVGILDGPAGTGVIEECSMKCVQLNCSFSDSTRPSAAIDLILAIPRPKAMKRLWAILASLGVRRIFLVNANKVERNYFDTHWIEPKHFQPLLIEGLEQAADTRLPQVSVIRRLKPFVEDRMDELFPYGTRILAHPSPEREVRKIEPASGPVVVALGPEGGWTPYEVDMFDSHGFLRMSLGHRILRTDTACVALISVLRHMMGD